MEEESTHDPSFYIRDEDARTIVLLLILGFSIVLGRYYFVFIPSWTSVHTETAVETTIKNDEEENKNGSGSGNSLLIDINTAKISDFLLLPGIGETLAERIVSEREKNGKFSSIDDLRRVTGIGTKKIDSIRIHLEPVSEEERMNAENKQNGESNEPPIEDAP